MRRKLHYEPIGMNLLSEKFTIAEIQALYETILNKKLDNTNFVKKLVSLEILRKTDEKKSIGGHWSPTLYKFNKRAYSEALKQEFELVF
jgi:8-oxo-dGTP diphosphatase